MSCFCFTSRLLCRSAIVIVMAIAAIAALCGWLTLQRHSAIAAWEAHTAGKALESIQGIAKFRAAGTDTGHSLPGHARSRRKARHSIRGISGALTAIQAAAPFRVDSRGRVHGQRFARR
jgi:hypothetical protein